MARQVTIRWSLPALDDLDEIAAWIAQDDPAAASELVQRALSAVEHLARFPLAGRRLPELLRSGWREVIVPPLRVIYRQDPRGVLVVHVVRSERRLRATKLRR